MRAHPIALGCYGQPASVLEEAAVGVARITHAHKHGITGGLLQTLAVHQVRYLVSYCTLKDYAERDSVTRWIIFFEGLKIQISTFCICADTF
jgi:ADP-ribosylglycohydrolase